MRKQIKLSTGVQEMSFEEVAKQFEQMINQKIRQHQLETVFNAVEAEDMRQHLLIHLWKAYEKYDITTGNCFSTMLFHDLRSGKREATSKLFAKKRVNEKGVTSLDKEFAEDASLIDMISYDENFDQQLVDAELVGLLEGNLTDMEKDVLHILIEESNGNRADKKAFATKWGMSRPTAYKRIADITFNLQEMVLDAGYMI